MTACDFLRKVRKVLYRGRGDGNPTGHQLTKAEKRVLNLILQGKSNKEVAYSLGRAVRTVEQHRSKIMRKFNADGIVDLVQKTAKLKLDDAL